MRRLHIPALFSGLLLSTLFVTATQANDRSLRAITIPVAGCQPSWDSAGGLIIYSWGVGSGQYAQILCPLPINNIELGTAAVDNDITKFRVHYRDSDGLGTGSRVSVAFYRTTSSPFSFNVICSQNLSTTIGTLTSTTVTCAHDVTGGGAFYGFSVEMITSAGTAAEFMGIDFPN